MAIHVPTLPALPLTWQRALAYGCVAYALTPYVEPGQSFKGSVLQVLLRTCFKVAGLLGRVSGRLSVGWTRLGLRLLQAPLPALHSAQLQVTDTQLSTLNTPVRIYRPHTHTHTHPGAIIYLHGGGWTIGSVATYDPVCRHLAHTSGWVVISVDYPLSPEHKYPAAPNACRDVISYVISNTEALGVDPQRIVVAGDSAGGNLAAVMTHMFGNEKGPGGKPVLCGQVLLYPAVDCCVFTPSMRTYGDRAGLSRGLMLWFWDQYLPCTYDPNDPYLFPLRAGDHSNLPPAYVAVAEHDVLCSEGCEYAKRLEGAGTPTTLVVIKGACHGIYNTLRGPLAMQQAYDSLDGVARWVNAL